MKKIALLLTLLAPIISKGQSNILTGNIAAFNLTGRSNVIMTLQLLSPINRTINPQTISNDRIETTSDQNGNYAFTNVLWGNYRLYAGDSSGSYWNAQIGTNAIGTIPIASFLKSAAAQPPNPGTNYLTEAQIDALIYGINTPTFDNTFITFDQP